MCFAKFGCSPLMGETSGAPADPSVGQTPGNHPAGRTGRDCSYALGSHTFRKFFPKETLLANDSDGRVDGDAT
jgi:hypothetical protein